MPFNIGAKAHFSLDNGAGVLQDLSAYITQVTLPESAEMHQSTTLGKTAHTFQPGLRTGTISLRGNFDPVMDAHMNGLWGAPSGSTSFVHGPAGNAAAARKNSGECYLVSYEVDDAVDGLATWSAELQVTDAIARGVFP